MSFTFSKNEELRSAGRFSTGSVSPNCCNSRRCSRVSLVGVITRTLTYRSPFPPPCGSGSPFPFKRMIAPVCVPSGMATFSSPVSAGHADLRAQSRLRDADGNRAVEIRAAPLEKRMLLHVQNDVEIARRRRRWRPARLRPERACASANPRPAGCARRSCACARRARAPGSPGTSRGSPAPRPGNAGRCARWRRSPAGNAAGRGPCRSRRRPRRCRPWRPCRCTLRRIPGAAGESWW